MNKISLEEFINQENGEKIIMINDLSDFECLIEYLENNTDIDCSNCVFNYSSILYNLIENRCIYIIKNKHKIYCSTDIGYRPFYELEDGEWNNKEFKKRTLLLICGKSASGKTEITKELNKSGISMLVSHTDRPMRNGEIGGVDYYFIHTSDMINMIDDGEFVETRSYNTEYGVWNYGLSKEEINNIDSAACVVLDLNGCESVKKYIDDNNLDIKTITIYISASEEERFRRYMNRDNVTLKQTKELIRRFEKDDEDFKDFEDKVDIMLRNETEEDLERNVKIIKNIIDK